MTVDFTVPAGVSSFTVTGSTPASGAVVVGATPGQYVLTLSAPVAPASVQPFRLGRSPISAAPAEHGTWLTRSCPPGDGSGGPTGDSPVAKRSGASTARNHF